MPRRSRSAESASRRSGRGAARAAREALYREMIFEAAEGAFAEKGVEATKMEEVASRAGLALGTVYSVVAGKAQLVAAIHEARMAEAVDAAERLLDAPGEPEELLMQGIEGYVTYFAERPDYLRMHLRAGTAWAIAGSARGAAQAEALRRGNAVQEEIFRRGIASGDFHPGEPRRLAHLLMAMQQVQLADWIEEGMQRDPAELVADMQAHARRAFCRSASREGARR